MASSVRILVDICHPAHAHFFRHPIAIWRAAGHQVMVTSRLKEVATHLLDAMGVPHRTLSTQRNGMLGMLRELIQRDWRLYRVAREFRPDVLTAIGGTFAAHAAWLARRPSVVFYDTENARLQNAITYPIASAVIVPRCYRGWLPRRHERYAGYHELSYLHPSRFCPSRDIALASGLADDRPTYLLRLVSWNANHDVGEPHLDLELVRSIAARLKQAGHLLISAEGDLPEDLARNRYLGAPEHLHDLMAFCAGYFGESATMASECAVLGVPAVYAACTGRGYTDEQEARYGLVRNAPQLLPEPMHAALDWLLARRAQDNASARERLLQDCIDVAACVAERVLQHAAHGRSG